MNIEVNNCVNVQDLHHEKEWIHGNLGTKFENISVTIFLVTICGNQLKYSLESINKLSLDFPVLVSVIMNISPTNKAYNMMRIRCKTKYFIQFDEDMEIYPNGIETMLNSIHKKKIFLRCYRLIDHYLGISNPPTIYGMKLYDNEIMKNYPTHENGDVAVSSVDRLWHEPILKDGYSIDETSIIIGYHARKRSPFDLLLRYSKLTNSLLDDKIKKNSGDLCKFLLPLNKLDNDSLLIYDVLIDHFISYGFDYDLYINNFNKLKLSIYKYIPKSSLDTYNLPSPYVNIGDRVKKEFNFDMFTMLFTLPIKYTNDVYCLIGIINKLFDNYSYSFDKYPYDVDAYFQKVFRMNVAIDSKLNTLKEKLSGNNFNIINIGSLPEDLCDLTIEPTDNENNILVNGIIKLENDDIKILDYIISHKRKSKIVINDNKEQYNVFMNNNVFINNISMIKYDFNKNIYTIQ